LGGFEQDTGLLHHVLREPEGVGHPFDIGEAFNLVTFLFRADTGPRVPGAEPAELAAFLPGELSTGPVALVADRRPKTLIMTRGGNHGRGTFAGPGVGVEVTPIGPVVNLVVIDDEPTVRPDGLVVFPPNGPVAFGAVIRVGGWAGRCWTERLDGAV
jgi:hypothetical protein